LGSTNGTWIGKRQVRSAIVDAGDRIEIGATQLELESLKQSVELPLSSVRSFGRLAGESAAIRRVFADLEAVAPKDTTVLLVGEAGTGKDAAAEAIHERSTRSNGPFVVVDLSVMAHGLLESELFGHESGAFTGATRRRIGAFEEAQGGTLFLDEIGELP